MANPSLNIALLPGMHVEPILGQKLKTDEFAYRSVAMGTADESTRRTLKGEFDVGEVSLATFLKARERGSSFKALPIFPSRKFLQPYMFCPEKTSFAHPRDLVGKKLAVSQFWMTSSVWHRWILEHYYDLSMNDFVWCPLRRDRIEDVPFPKNLRVDWGYLDQSPEDLLHRGDIDCLLTARLEGGKGIRRLYSEPIEEASNFYEKTGIMPVMHVIVVKEELLIRHPILESALVRLFTKARATAFQKTAQAVALVLPFADLYLHDMQTLFATKTWNEYGWSQCEKPLKAFYNAVREQGLIQGSLSLESCFSVP